jgi:hypothetical protein
MDMFNDSNLIVPEYCDNCGHLVLRYHLIWKDENNNTTPNVLGQILIGTTELSVIWILVLWTKLPLHK